MREHIGWRRHALWALTALVLCGCAGEFVAPGEDPGGGDAVGDGAASNGASSGADGTSPNTSTGATSDGGCEGAACLDEVAPCTELPCGTTDDPPVAAPTTRFTRLTHWQWENTVQDLFNLPAPPNVASTFIADPTSTGFSTNTTNLNVSPELWVDYQRGAETMAKRIVSDPERLADLVPDDAPNDLEGRKWAFLEAFLGRAYRRGVTDEELARYGVLFDAAADQLDAAGPFEAGVEMTIRAALQSPHFVFRVELSDQVDGQGRVRLNGYEIASRLSYALWDTMPSDTLLAAAERGELDTMEQVREQVEWMMDDPRARALVASFHREVLKTNLYTDMAKVPERFPEFTADTGRFMQIEMDRFIEDTIFEQSGGFIDLLTSRRTFVNANLAEIYRLEGAFSDEFVAVELDDAERSGLLTRLGFLAQNASALEQDPIHRGVFVAHDLLCKAIPSPPDNVPPVPGDAVGTVRERVTAHTGAGTCGAGCHSTLINPPGFAFESYDGLGRFQTEESGAPVDAADTWEIDGQPVAYRDALDFSEFVAHSREANVCYTRRWLEYVYGREAASTDMRLIGPVAEASRQGTFSIRDLLTALLVSDAFLTRAVEEETDE